MGGGKWGVIDNGYGVLVDDKNVLELDSGDNCKILQMH